MTINTRVGRLAAGARGHDWFVVGLELLVVIVGIFLGLQADAWNTQRQQRIQEREYLALLQDDVGQMITDFAEDANEALERRRAMSDAVRALQADDDGEEAHRAVAASLLSYQVAPSVRYRDATYSEMVSAGALARMEDLELKRLIVTTFSSVRLVNESIGRYRTSMPVVDDVVWRNVSYGLGSSDDEVTVLFDIHDLAQNREVQNAFVEMIDLQGDTRRVLEDAIEELRGLLDMLRSVRRDLP